jgi:hypothetical protein
MSAAPGGRARVRAAGLAILLAGVLHSGAATAARGAAPPEDFYGVNSGSGLVDDAAGRPAAFDAMRAGGLSYVRVDASWNAIEPALPTGGVHAYVWTTYDPFVADLARSGLRWYPMLGYSAPWAASTAGDPFSPPAGDADFAAFAAALAARYGTRGSFWAEHPELPRLPTTTYGIWNEPSNDRFWHGPEATPERYMRLYLAARAAIKVVDPGARVATAGLLDSAVVDANAYLRAMLASAPHARIDAVGWHPYLGEVELILASVRRARSTLDEHGLHGVPIEISEVGWHSGTPDAWRTAWMRELAASLPQANLNVTRLMPYVWSGDAVWRMTNPDGTLAPLGEAYLAGIRDARPALASAPARLATGRRALSGCRIRPRGSRRRWAAVRSCLSRVARPRNSASGRPRATRRA